MNDIRMATEPRVAPTRAERAKAKHRHPPPPEKFFRGVSTTEKISARMRIANHIMIGIIARIFSIIKIQNILFIEDKTSIRQRNFPSYMVVYYVIFLAIYGDSSCREALGCFLEGLQWLCGSSSTLKVTGKSGISQARARIGWEPMQRLYDSIVRPITAPETRKAWYRERRLVSLDSGLLDVVNTSANLDTFGRQSAGGKGHSRSQLRFVSLVESGTNVLFGARMAGFDTSERTLAVDVLPRLTPGMLCVANGNFFEFGLWKQARETGSDLLWQANGNTPLPQETPLVDGSYLSRIVACETDCPPSSEGMSVRVIDFRPEGQIETKTLSRLVTTMLDPIDAPAAELVALFHEHAKIETSWDDFKANLGGTRIALRSKTPDLVRQEFYGLMMAHFAIQNLIHDAALRAD